MKPNIVREKKITPNPPQIILQLLCPDAFLIKILRVISKGYGCMDELNAKLSGLKTKIAKREGTAGWGGV